METMREIFFFIYGNHTGHGSYHLAELDDHRPNSLGRITSKGTTTVHALRSITSNK